MIDLPQIKRFNEFVEGDLMVQYLDPSWGEMVVMFSGRDGARQWIQWAKTAARPIDPDTVTIFRLVKEAPG